MAVTVGEAHAINTVLSGLASMGLDELDSDFAAALEVLAHSAHQRLAAGWSVARVAEQWPALTPVAVTS